MKKFILLGLLFVLGCFLFGLHYVQNSHPNSSIGKRYLGNSFKPVSWYEWNNFLDLKSYGFGKPSSEDALILDFSDNDLKYNDSIILQATSDKAYFNDALKEWKKTHIIFNKKRYKVKYKFHGSHNFNYKQGKLSLKIKSNSYIKGVKQFSLISGFLEGSFINVFIANQEKNLGLIGPDPGSVVLANVNGKVEDFWFTQDMSEDYLQNQFGLKDYKVFEVSDNWTRNSGPHYSELDGYYYYLDSENLPMDSLKYRKFKEYKTQIAALNPGDELPNTDYDYMGKFLAHLYFYYHNHHASGDNNKLLYDYEKKMVYPIARNEGMYERIPNIIRFDLDLNKNIQKESHTMQLYYKAMCNDSIRLIRNKALYDLAQNSEKHLLDLDSLSSLYYPLHKFYNVSFIDVRFKIKKIRDVIKHNSKIINNYINTGEIAVAYSSESNTLNIATDIRVPMRMVLLKSGQTHTFNGYSIQMEKGTLTNKVIENQIQLSEKITKEDIRFVNTVSGDTLLPENVIFNYF